VLVTVIPGWSAKIEAQRSGINYEEVRHRRAESTDSGSYRRLI
jgi:hypothetical protein